jgi:hypothetical protein
MIAYFIISCFGNRACVMIDLTSGELKEQTDLVLQKIISKYPKYIGGSILPMELWALHILGKCSTTDPHAQPRSTF